jgi:hypothetical protein
MSKAEVLALIVAVVVLLSHIASPARLEANFRRRKPPSASDKA